MLILLASNIGVAAPTTPDNALDDALLDIELLPQLSFIPASRIANQVSDASSAVSIVTADDIKAYGYRTLGEILNSMRGVFVTQDYQYQFLGGRGYGLPGEYSGRILLLIDGYRAQDGYFGQAYFGEDGLLDVALIDRVEYIPGSGSSGYGDGALLAAINVITKKGSDINGAQVAASVGSHDSNQERLTYGKKLENGADILFSTSRYDTLGRNFSYPASSNIVAGRQTGDNSEDNMRMFFKGAYNGWTLETAAVKRNIELPSAPNLGVYTAPSLSSDTNAFIQLKYDTDINAKLRFSAQSYYGQYDYRYDEQETSDYSFRVKAAWYGLDTKFVGTWFDRHTLVFGAEYRDDVKLDAHVDDGTTAENFQNSRKTYSVYGYDNIALTDKLGLNLGARYEASDNGKRLFNPRAALIYKPRVETTLKLSTGASHRQATVSEITSSNISPKPERIRSAELVLEQSLGWQSRVIASLYRYKIDSRILFSSDPNFVAPDITTKGAELEFEKQWENGTRLRTSYAKQLTVNSWGLRPYGSPRDNVKFNITTPLVGEKLRAGLELRYLGPRRIFSDAYRFTGGYTIADLTFTSKNLLPQLDASLSVRNLFDREYGDVASPLYDEQYLFLKDGRNLWFQMEYRFR